MAGSSNVTYAGQHPPSHSSEFGWRQVVVAPSHRRTRRHPDGAPSWPMKVLSVGMSVANRKRKLLELLRQGPARGLIAVALHEDSATVAKLVHNCAGYMLQ